MLFIIAKCSNVNPAGGGTIETTNGFIKGRVVDLRGNPAPYAQVTLLPENYNPLIDTVPFAIETADCSGNYAFRNLIDGSYNIQVLKLDDRTRSLICGIKVCKDTVIAPTAALNKTGVVAVTLPDCTTMRFSYIYVPGTTIFTFLTRTGGTAFLDSVPAGSLPLISCSSINTTTSTAIRYNVAVISGDTSKVLNPSWAYACKLVLNTSATGAKVTSTIRNFPVLVRLTSSNFSFVEARAGGADCRFTKRNNTSLPFEVERWDSTDGQAEVWVRIDTVYGNNDSQSIIMYWGNPTAMSASNSGAVFDTAAGFQGVWHLAQGGTDTARDATYNHFNGVPYRMSANSTVPGIIGTCQQFDGDSGFFDITGTASGKLNFPENGLYTVSAWVYLDTLDALNHAIVAKGNQQYALKVYTTKKWEFFEYETQPLGYDQTASPASANAWTHLAGVRNNGKQYLYINGACVDSADTFITSGHQRYTGYDVTIGKLTEYSTGVVYSFKGKIDEARISNVACSADWIKLCYMNQKNPDALTVFK
jgi:hypothetical protein